MTHFADRAIAGFAAAPGNRSVRPSIARIGLIGSTELIESTDSIVWMVELFGSMNSIGFAVEPAIATTEGMIADRFEWTNPIAQSHSFQIG